MNLVSLVGFGGTALVVGAFALNSWGFVPSDAVLYQLLNLIGAIFLGIDMYVKGVWSGFTVQIVWGCVALITLLKMLMIASRKPWER